LKTFENQAPEQLETSRMTAYRLHGWATATSVSGNILEIHFNVTFESRCIKRFDDDFFDLDWWPWLSIPDRPRSWSCQGHLCAKHEGQRSMHSKVRAENWQTDRWKRLLYLACKRSQQ